MKVFDLSCKNDHRFEGWFGSAEDYADQQERGLIECPMCACRTVRKMPSAARLNLSGASGKPEVAQQPRSPVPQAPAEAAREGSPDPRALQALLMQMARAIARNTEDVGERFAEEARRIHYREAPERGIRGVASAQQAQELVEEGIEVYALPMPAVIKEPLQ